ncbi:hypothetical protein ACA910_015373 [Epithemia clementina (nom. ined.)]
MTTTVLVAILGLLFHDRADAAVKCGRPGGGVFRGGGDSSPTSFEVALWGDLPYVGTTTGVFEETPGVSYAENRVNVGVDYKHLRDCINGAPNNLCNTTQPPAFAWFAGDMVSGETACIEKYYDRFENLANSFLAPSLYVLGDNEWLDCHKTKTKEPHDPLVKLNYVKRRFFDPSGRSILGVGHITTVNGGPNYPELQMWEYQGILFVGVTVVGSNNGLYDNDLVNGKECAKSLENFDPGCVRATAEFRERSEVVNMFVAQAFEYAKKNRLPGVMVMIQADIWGVEKCTDSMDPIDTGFLSFYQAFFDQVTKYKGQVALIHGDSHVSLICGDKPETQLDLPTYGKLSNFISVQLPGSINIGWTKATVEPCPYSSNGIFSFENIYVVSGPYYDP